MSGTSSSDHMKLSSPQLLEQSVSSPALSRKSSLDDFINEFAEENLAAVKELSATSIQKWWRESWMRLSAVRSKLRAGSVAHVSTSSPVSVVAHVLTVLSALRGGSAQAQLQFERSCELVQARIFTEAFSKLLQALPRDTKLMKNAYIKTRNGRYMSAAIMIAYHPLELLSLDSSSASWESARLINASRLYTHSLYRLCIQAASTTTPLGGFKAALSGLRFSTRYFVHAMEGWKLADTMKTLQELQSVYGNICAALVQHTATHSEDQQTTQALVFELAKVKAAIFNLVKDDASRVSITAELEEIEANAHNRSLELTGMTRGTPSAEVSSSSLSNSSPPQNGSTNPPSIENAATGQDIEPTVTEEQEKVLAKLNSLLQTSSEKIVADLYFGEKLRLPTPPMGAVVWGEQETSDDAQAQLQTQSNVSQHALKLHRRMVKIIADRIVASMQDPSIASVEGITTQQQVQVFQLERGQSAISQRVGVAHNAVVAAVNVDGSFDVRYTVDEVLEPRVSASRLRVLGDLPNYRMLLQLIAETMESVCALTPSRADLISSLTSAVDLPTLVRICEAGALKPRHLIDVFGPLVSRMQELQAPARVSRTQRWADDYFAKCAECKTFNEIVPLLPRFFELMQALTEECRMDMASFYANSLEPVVHQVGPLYLRQKFLQQVASGSVKLQTTVKWITAQVADLETLQPKLAAANLPAISISNLAAGNDEDVKLLIALGLVALLQTNMRLDTSSAAAIIPETLVVHASRLAKLRDFVDRIAIVCACNATCKQFVMAKGGTRTLMDIHEQPFCTRLDVLLRQPDVYFPEVVVEITRYVTKCLGEETSPRHNKSMSAPVSVLSREEEEQLTNSVRDTMKPANPVLTLFTKRCYLLLLRAFMSCPLTPFLRPFSLTVCSEVVQEMGQLASALFDLNLQVHGEIYKQLITTASGQRA